ncbi:MAG TPA: 16S rRNA (adenine(1518)-N(6)/adenine(1519)-N(6))-dimethyltransferase RsmA [Chthoniobacterales bacterium]|nr:16S rRNA (adenine(1518)-N(6)/adenine(1519)-N(6))-dimethyltransferase RsmA [Chthoniobacterales bacterium]
MKLSEIFTTLRQIHVAPVKSLGQNFLHDQNLARWIVERAELERGDFVVEIGPGLGALTEIALKQRANVLAIEKDKRLADYVREKFSGKALEVLHGDALEFDTRILYTRAKVKLLGNLPYYIASQLLIKYLEFPSPISLWLLMLQKELAKRLTATPRTSDYAALTLTLQFYHRIEYLRSVDANVFLPKPDVDSALVRVTPREWGDIPHCDFEIFQKLVRLGFSQRRKQLGKLLRDKVVDWETVAANLGFNSRARAEELSFEEWIALAQHVAAIEPENAEISSAEQFTIVDEQDRPIGTAPRAQVHANNLLHRAVHILVFNSTGEVLLQLRSRWKDRHPLKWDSSAAGHVNAGEEYDQTAERELEEELGIKTRLERMAKLGASERTGYEFIWLYSGRYDGDFKLNRGEIEAARFFPPDVVDGWIESRPGDFAPGFVECWKIRREKNR